jgi:hypothetical protein
MNNTLSDFSTYPNKYVSRPCLSSHSFICAHIQNVPGSDIIAIATVFAVATCSGPVIPYRGGRIDANVAGPLGVPDPSDSLDSLKNNFAKQGFNVSEMIQLVACGHTLGGVRYPDFPTVVAATSGTVVDLFDGTQQFDHNMFVCSIHIVLVLTSCAQRDAVPRRDDAGPVGGAEPDYGVRPAGFQQR